MLAKINFDGEDRWAVILPAYASQLDASAFRSLSLFLNLIVGNYAEKMPVDALVIACGLAKAMTETGNANEKKYLALPK